MIGGAKALLPKLLIGRGQIGRKIEVLAAPSNLGLRSPEPGRQPGVNEAPNALLSRGLLEKIHAEYAGEVVAPVYEGNVDPHTGVRNAAQIRQYSVDLAGRLDKLLSEPVFPLLLGGDCSILIGSSLALKQRGRFGLLFIDGHTDLATPARSQSSGAAGMDLALVTGQGPDSLASIHGLGPYIQPEDVVLFGFRYPPLGSQLPELPRSPMRSVPLPVLQRMGAEAAAKMALTFLRNRPFWIHLDVDVLDPRWMPAVDSPDPGGLSPRQLVDAVSIAVDDASCAGLEVTIYDPTRDPSGRAAILLVNLLTQCLKSCRSG